MKLSPVNLAITAINPVKVGSIDELGCAKLARIPIPESRDSTAAGAVRRLRRVAGNSAKTQAFPAAVAARLARCGQLPTRARNPSIPANLWLAMWQTKLRWT